MTPEQCHPVYCNSQQVEGSAGWDRHSSSTINRWTARMKGAEEYITREISRRWGWQFGRHQEDLSVEYQKRRKKNHPWPRTEDKLWPFPQPRCWRSSSPTIPPDRWRHPHKGPILKPASLPNSLYWTCWVWVCSHLQWKEPPKSEPYRNKIRKNYIIKFKNWYCF